MGIGSKIAIVLVPILGLVSSVGFVYYYVEANAIPGARNFATQAFIAFFVIPTAVLGMPGIAVGLANKCDYPAKFMICGSAAGVLLFALYNLTFGFSKVLEFNQYSVSELIAVGPLLLALVWVLLEAQETSGDGRRMSRNH